MLFLILFAVFLSLVTISWLNMLWEAKRSNVPGPFPLPVVGNGHLLLVDSARLLWVFSEYCTKYKDAVRCHIMTEKFALFSHPKYIEQIISSTDNITKGRSYDYLRPWLGQGLLTATGNRWKTHRKFLTPAFHFNILHSFLPVFLKNTRVLTRQLRHKADGTPFDLFPIMAMIALDNVTESIMGVSFNAQKDSESKYVKAIESLSEIVSLRQRNLILANELLFSLSSYKRVQKEALEILHGHTKMVIEARRRELENVDFKISQDDTGMKNKCAFLDLLLLAEVDGKPISDEAVREEVDTFMFEGHDTTASGLTYSLYCIANHNDVQQKILEEQNDIFGDDANRDPTFADLQQMKYLECVIKESLRLYPSVPFIQRLITKDTDVMHMRLLKDTSLIINIFHLQRHPDLFEDPLWFRPERFQEVPKARNAYNWIPFSAGPRNCIGQKFAMLELKVTLAAIVRQYKLIPSGIEPELCGALILKAKNGVTIKLKPRI